MSLSALCTEFSTREGRTEMFIGSSCRKSMLQFDIFSLFRPAFRDTFPRVLLVPAVAFFLTQRYPLIRIRIRVGFRPVATTLTAVCLERKGLPLLG